MKIILQDNVPKLGNAGDIVETKRGYFRNFLEPRGLAVVATKGTLKKREEDKEALERKAQKAHDAAVALGEKITQLPPIEIPIKAGESGKLYGKVTNKEIASKLEELIEEAIDKRGIKTHEDVNALGDYKVSVKLTPKVQVECEIKVVVEGNLVKDKPPEEPKDKTAEGGKEKSKGKKDEEAKEKEEK